MVVALLDAKGDSGDTLNFLQFLQFCILQVK